MFKDFVDVCRGLIEIWRHLLEKTADMAKQKQTIADLLHTQIPEMMKQQKRVKEAAFKRVRDTANVASSWPQKLERMISIDTHSPPPPPPQTHTHS